MIAVKDFARRVKEVFQWELIIFVRTGYALQAVEKNSFEDLQTSKVVMKNAKTTVAGGISLETLPEVIKLNPALVIVGCVAIRHKQ